MKYSLILLATCLFLCSCDVLLRDKEEVKKITNDLIDEEAELQHLKKADEAQKQLNEHVKAS